MALGRPISTLALLRRLLLLLLLLLSSSSTDCAKVLFTFYHDRGSHFSSMLPMVEKIALQRRHSVTVLHTFSPTRPVELPASVRAVIAPLPQDEDDRALAPFIWNRTITNQVLAMVYADGNSQLERLMLSHPKKVVDLLDEEWDLIVVDDLFWSFGFFLATLKKRLWEAGRDALAAKEPRMIIFSTAGQTLHSAESVRATSRNWVSKAPLFPYLPTGPEDVYQPNRFTHRLFAFRENFGELILMNWLVERFMLSNIAKFGVPNFSWHELHRGTVIQLSDSIDRMGWPQAQSTEMVNVGAHCKQPKGLPAEFARFMEDPSSEGTIFIAFGTYPQWGLAPSRVLDALIGAFQRLSSHRIIFAYNGPPIAGLDGHIMLTKWAPQREILAHPSLRAFITHGGLKSVKEAICASVPIIAMPLFAEQSHQAHLLLATGISRRVINKFTLTADSVFSTIHAVISDPQSVLRARRFRALFLDRPMDGLDEGLFHLERVLRGPSGERAQFVKRRRGMDLGWIAFVHADLAAILLASIILLAATKGS